MEVKILDNNRKSLEVIDALWKENRATLGFYPLKAFQEALKKGLIIGCVEDGIIIGYLLFRISRKAAHIVHLCVGSAFHGKQAGKKMVEFLKKKTASCSGIRLRCRNDFSANDIWPKYNFVPVSERKGRSIKGLPLTEWWYQHNQPNLFSAQATSTPRITACIDANVFYDLTSRTDHDESVALKGDWLQSEVDLCVTRELYNEINRGTEEERKASRGSIKRFKHLPFNESKFQKVLSNVESIMPSSRRTDASDVRQLAQAIVGGAEFFITRDERILRGAKKVFNVHHIKVRRPVEFILELDQAINYDRYVPSLLVNHQIVSGALTESDITDDLIESLLDSGKGEKKHELKKLLYGLISDPNKFSSLSYKTPRGSILALLVYSQNNNVITLDCIRVSKSPLKETLFRNLVLTLISERQVAGQTQFVLQCDRFDAAYNYVLEELGFIQSEADWIKLSINGVRNRKELKDMDLSERESRILKQALATNDTFLQEKLLWPLKVEDGVIPCFIVPIKPKWAAELFDYRLLNQELFAKDKSVKLVLNRENVYYRSPRPAILEFPARILWYVSKGDARYSGNMQIRACSYIDSIEIGVAEKLYYRYKNLGIYRKSDVIKTAKEKKGMKEVMAFKFSGTELLNPVTIHSLRALYRKLESKALTLQGPLRISNKLFNEIYEKGKR